VTFRWLIAIPFSALVSTAACLASPATPPVTTDAAVVDVVAVDVADASVPACESSTTLETIAAETSYCANWVEILEFPACKLTAIARYTTHGIEQFYFDSSTHRLVRKAVFTDTDRTVICSNIADVPCLDYSSCRFVCLTSKAAHEPQCREPPPDAAAPGDATLD
jgi:hypothetical protein